MGPCSGPGNRVVHCQRQDLARLPRVRHTGLLHRRKSGICKVRHRQPALVQSHPGPGESLNRLLPLASRDRRKVIRWSLIAFFILNLALAISTFVADLCQCTPVSYHWNQYKTDTYDDTGKRARQDWDLYQRDQLYPHHRRAVRPDRHPDHDHPGRDGLGSEDEQVEENRRLGGHVPRLVVVIVGAVRIFLFVYQSRPGFVDPTYSLGFTISGAEVNM